jgi:ribosomal protein S2
LVHYTKACDAGQQTKKLKSGKKEVFREKTEKRKLRKRRKGIGDMQSLQIFH